MNGLLLAASVLMNVLACGILRNEFCKKDIDNNTDLQAFNAVSSLFSAITLAIIAAVSGQLHAPSAYTVLLGIVFGLVTALGTIMSMKALECGPLSYTCVITSCAMVIPAFSGLVLFGESVTLPQYIGVALIVLSCACAVDKDNSESGASVKWLLLCLGAFLSSGIVGVLQKVHQNSPHKDELGVFLVCAFVVSALTSVGLTAYYRRQKGDSITVFTPAKRKKFALIVVISGVGCAFCNQINMYLAGVMDAILFYPVVNGAGMLLTSAAGLILWREKLSRKQWCGMVMGAIALFLLCGVL